MEPLVLASASPRRSALLSERGVPFEVAPTHVDESLDGTPSAEDAARELALRKAQAAVNAQGERACWVLAADTVVGLPPTRGAEDPDGGAWRLLGKPADDAEARAMLEELSGSRHVVVTGIAVGRIRAGSPHAELRGDAETTVVTMRAITREEIEAYVASGEWRGKAGGYAIQETADRFVTELDGGGFDNVVGLPVARTMRLLEGMGWPGAVAGDPPAR